MFYVFADFFIKTITYDNMLKTNSSFYRTTKKISCGIGGQHRKFYKLKEK